MDRKSFFFKILLLLPNTTLSLYHLVLYIFSMLYFSSIFALLPMNHLLFHLPNNKHYGAVMMHHVPSTVMKLVNVGHIEWPRIHVNICFHANPSHICKHTSPYITDLKINPLFPIKCNLPTLNYGIIPVERKSQTW